MFVIQPEICFVVVVVKISFVVKISLLSLSNLTERPAALWITSNPETVWLIC